MIHRWKIASGLFVEMIESFIAGNTDWAKFCWFLAKETFLGHCTRVDGPESKEVEHGTEKCR